LFSGILTEKKRAQQEFLTQNFSLVIQRLIEGDVIQFSNDITSCRLSEALMDLRMLEKEGRVAVVGNALTGEELDALVSRYSKICLVNV